MEVDQKHITTIRLHDATGGEICLTKHGEDYHLRLACENNVVNITLGLADVRKLYQQIIQLEIEQHWPQGIGSVEGKSIVFQGGGRSLQENMANYWFARMAGEMCNGGRR